MHLEGFLDWKSVLGVDLPPMAATSSTRRQSIESAGSGRYSPQEPRMGMGLFYVENEYEMMRAEELSRPLP